MRWPTVGGGKSSPIYLQDLGSPFKAAFEWSRGLLDLASIPESEWPSHARVYCPVHDRWEWHDRYCEVFSQFYQAQASVLTFKKILACQEDLNSPRITHYYLIEINGFPRHWKLEYINELHRKLVTWKILSVT